MTIRNKFIFQVLLLLVILIAGGLFIMPMIKNIEKSWAEYQSGAAKKSEYISLIKAGN